MKDIPGGKRDLRKEGRGTRDEVTDVFPQG